MKRYSILFALLMFVLTCTTSSLATKKHTQEELLKQATITQADATKTALAKVPNGTIKESELEMEHGKLVWSFDIATPDSKDITEVQVDAKTGKIVSVEKESAASEAKEKK